MRNSTRAYFRIIFGSLLLFCLSAHRLRNCLNLWVSGVWFLNHCPLRRGVDLYNFCFVHAYVCVCVRVYSIVPNTFAYYLKEHEIMTNNKQMNVAKYEQLSFQQFRKNG